MSNLKSDMRILFEFWNFTDMIFWLQTSAVHSHIVPWMSCKSCIRSCEVMSHMLAIMLWSYWLVVCKVWFWLRVHSTSYGSTSFLWVPLLCYVLFFYKTLLTKFQMSWWHAAWTMSFLSNTLVTLTCIWRYFGQHMRHYFITLNVTFIACLWWPIWVYPITKMIFRSHWNILKFKWWNCHELQHDHTWQVKILKDLYRKKVLTIIYIVVKESCRFVHFWMGYDQTPKEKIILAMLICQPQSNQITHKVYH